MIWLRLRFVVQIELAHTKTGREVFSASWRIGECFENEANQKYNWRTSSTCCTRFIYCLDPFSVRFQSSTELSNLYTTHLADQYILFVEMSSKHFRWLAGYRFNFEANFLAFSCRFNGFMIDFNRCHDSNVQKLKAKKKTKRNDEYSVKNAWNC